MDLAGEENESFTNDGTQAVKNNAPGAIFASGSAERFETNASARVLIFLRTVGCGDHDRSNNLAVINIERARRFARHVAMLSYRMVNIELDKYFSIRTMKFN